MKKVGGNDVPGFDGPHVWAEMKRRPKLTIGKASIVKLYAFLCGLFAAF